MITTFPTVLERTDSVWVAGIIRYSLIIERCSGCNSGRRCRRRRQFAVRWSKCPRISYD
jgi:hypothetical protein